MRDNIILGLFGPGPNPSAALFVEGELVVWIEEERLNRIKTAPNSLPIQAAIECLKHLSNGIDDVSAIAFGWDSVNFIKNSPRIQAEIRAKYNDSDSFNELQDLYITNLYHPTRIKRGLQIGLGYLSKDLKLPPIYFYPHHLSHAASAFYLSGFEEANILTLDGSGEELTGMLAVGRGGDIEVIKKFELPHSLGGFYATMTEYLGFKPYIDEGKVMGLASYGTFNKEIFDKISCFIKFDPDTGDFIVDPTFRYIGNHSYGSRFTDKLVELLGTPRPKHITALSQPYIDIAYCTQFITEQIAVSLTRQLFKLTGIRNICLAGGVAMNCVMNGKIANLDHVDDIFVQPAASDNGVSLGAALLHMKSAGVLKKKKLEHLYYGIEYSNEEIEKFLKEAKLNYYLSTDITKETATFLNEGKIIGWFQGRMEIGARALGGRSILGNPVLKYMKDKINKEVKHRESWRPFCPSIKEESYGKYIESDIDSPFMILAFPVIKEMRDKIPSCVHVDGTARPQKVKKSINPLFWKLLDEFGKLSGHDVLINTSFNIQGEPIVCSPKDALRTFGGTGIDILVIGDFVIKKHD